MAVWKSKAIGLLMTVTLFPIGAADPQRTKMREAEDEAERGMSATGHRSPVAEKHILEMNLPELVGHFHKAETKEEIHHAADAMIHLLTITQDRVQAELAAHRREEQTTFAERAYKAGFDYTRLHQYVPGAQGAHERSSSTAADMFENSGFTQYIKTHEEMLRQIHALMSLVEQVRDTKLSHGSAYMGLFEKLSGAARKFEVTFGAGSDYSHLHMGGVAIMLEPEDLNSVDQSHCPDKLVVGKKISTLLPHFTMEGWSHSQESMDMRTGRSKHPVTKIRLQGRLWDIFAGKQIGQMTPYHPPMGHWDLARGMWVEPQDDTIGTFLPRTNLKSRICEYKFEVVERGRIGPHYRGPVKATYSMVFIPAAEDQLEPRDKSYDPVQDQLAQEIEGEGFKAPDVNNPRESRQAIGEEMEQRLGRRTHDRYLREERGYLKPSHIKSQTYGRVHVPDYRYGRTYERIYDIVPAHPASKEEISLAKSRMGRWELHHRDREDEGRSPREGRSTVPQG